MSSIDLLYPGVWGRLHTGTRKKGPILFGICSVPLLTSGTTRVLVDTGHFGTRMHLVAALEERGLTPADIDVVVLSHLHWDHILNIELFPQALVVMHHQAMSYAVNAPTADWAAIRFADRLLAGFSVREVRDGDEIAPGLNIIDTPGHTAADISVVVRGESQTSVVAADAVTNARSFLDREPRLLFHDPKVARESIERIADLADVVYSGHDRPFTHTNGNEIEYIQDGLLEVTCVEWFGTHDDYSVTISAPAGPRHGGE